MMPSHGISLLLTAMAVLVLVARLGWSGEPPGDEAKPAREDGAAEQARLRVKWRGRLAPPEAVELTIESLEDDVDPVRLTVPTGQTVLLPVGLRAPRVWEAHIGEWETDQGIPEVARDADGTYVVLLDVPGRTTLLVRGADGEPLADAEVQAGNDLFGATFGTSSSWTSSNLTLYTGTDGRLVLPPTTRPGEWSVRTAEHVARRVATSPDVPYVDVELKPGGALDIVVRADVPLPEHWVRAFRGAAEDVYLLDQFRAERLRPGLYSIEGLPAGTWTVNIGAPGDIWNEWNWASASVEVVAGAVAAVTLDVSEKSLPASGELVLLVHLPAEWGLTPTPQLRGCSAAVARTELPEIAGERIDASTWCFTWPAVREGLYEIVLPEVEYLDWVRAPSRNKPRHVYVPQPRELVVDVVDAVSGDAIQEAYVGGWCESELPNDFVAGRGCSHCRLRAADAPGTYSKRLPLGSYEIEVEAPGYAPWCQTVLVEAGDKQLRLQARLARGASILLRLVDQGQPAARKEYDISLYDAAEGEDFETMYTIEGNTELLESLKPGTYVLSVSEPNAQTSRTLRVTIKAGEHRIIEFDVGREAEER